MVLELPVGASSNRARLDIRRNPALNDRIILAFYNNRALINQEDNGVVPGSPLDEDYGVTSTNTDWYDVQVKAVGAKVEVWRAKRGEAWSKVLETNAATVLTGDRVSFNAAPNSTAKYDDLGFCAVFPGRSFHDAFDDNNYTTLPAWTTFGGSWSAALGDMANTAYGMGTSGFYRNMTDDDFDLSFTYTSSDTSSSGYYAWIDFRRTNDNNRYILSVENTGLKIIKVDNGTWSTPVAKWGLTTTQGQAYDVQMIVEGKRVEVWRGLAGQEKSLLFSWDDATLFSSGNRMTFRVSANARYRFDNISFNTPDPQRAGHWYNAANELTMAQENGRITRYTYDDWGRTVSKTQASYAAAYQYRPGDMLKRVDTNFPGETTVRYLVDGLMKRRYEGVNTGTNFSSEVTTTYRYDLGWNALAEYGGSIDGSGTLLFGARQKSYVYHGMTPLAEIASANPGTGTAAYYGHDHLGSTRGLYSASKACVATTDYDPYGNVDPGNTGSPAYTYTGKQWSDEVDMYHFPYRYYQPQSGRWLTRDPLGMVDGPNVYGYAENAPTIHIDELGLTTRDDCDKLYKKLSRACRKIPDSRARAICWAAAMAAYAACIATCD